jgi:hypothetical protein
MGAILKIGNRLNRAGVESLKTNADGFTVESLTKLNQVKTNQKTTLLFYVASIIQRWNAPLLCVKDEMPNVLKAQNVTAHETTLKSLEQELEGIKKIAQSFDVRVKGEGDSSEISAFVHQASESVSKLREASNVFDTMFDDVRSYLALENNVKPNALFATMTSFCNDLNVIHSQLKKEGKRKQYRGVRKG